MKAQHEYIKMKAEGFKCSNGFTLLELIIVIFVLSLLFTVSITSIDHMVPRYRLRAGQREVADMVKIAKAKAASLSKDVYIQYDLSNNDYWLLVPFEREKDEKKWVEYESAFYKKLPDGIEFKDLILPIEKGAKVDKGIHTITFSPFGYSGYHIVNLRGEGDSVASIKVNGLTGAVYYYEEYKDQEMLLKDE